MSRADYPLKYFEDDERDLIDVTGVDYVSVAAENLQRSIKFYARLFGFRVVEDAREHRHPYVVLNAGGSVYLSIHERHGNTTRCRWSFTVRDLDEARKAIWNLGVAPADGSDEPRRTCAWREGRSFLIRDPDQHEIELVEVFGLRAAVPARSMRVRQPTRGPNPPRCLRAVPRVSRRR